MISGRPDAIRIFQEPLLRLSADPEVCCQQDDEGDKGLSCPDSELDDLAFRFDTRRLRRRPVAIASMLPTGD
jgi:hypothetical protein